jgi:hypothetical protein
MKRKFAGGEGCSKGVHTSVSFTVRLSGITEYPSTNHMCVGISMGLLYMPYVVSILMT